MVLEGPQRIPFPPRRFYPGEAMIPLEPGLHRTEPAWITGACLAVRRSVFETAGGFDPDYFLYFEETDLCLRIRRAGYRIGWLPQFTVWHTGQHSHAALSEYQRACNLFSGLTVFWQKHYDLRDVRSMLRFQCLAASVMLLCGRLLPGEARRRPAFRRERLRARRDMFRRWLMRQRSPLLPVDFRSWRIFARMLHLALAWLRGGGRLDLDDF
jgi:GT2 family glycosyltransferase